ncbi:MAG: peptidoglycan DD-metalloendopeptidase family protein [Bacteroidia bacterium]
MRSTKSTILFVAAFILTFLCQKMQAQTYSKVSSVDFGYTTTGSKSLYVRPFPGTACKFGAQRSIKKATLFALLDRKSEFRDAGNADYQVVVNVTAYSTFSGTSGAVTVPGYTPITLHVNKNQPQSYIAIDFTALYNTINRFVVTATYSPPSGTAETYTESVILTTVYYTEEFEYTVSQTGVPTFTVNPVTFAGTEATFSWNTLCDIAPDYQFQLLRLYNVDPAKTTNEHDITAQIDWDKALTIETENSLTQLKLSITEGTGYYIWRVRQIGNAFEGGVGNDRNWGDWTNTGSFVQGYSGAVTTDISPYVFFYKQFDDDRNWIFNRSFIEGDAVTHGQVDIGEGMNYANGLQMAQQQQTRIKSDQKIITSETIYDYSGRPALNSLAAPLNSVYSYTPEGSGSPAPTNSSALGYIPSYIKDASGNSYSADNFDLKTMTISNYRDPEKVDTTVAGPGKYYSYGNTLETNIATASGYPFSRTLFMRDGTSKPKEQSSPGLFHKLGNSGNDRHTTRNYTSSTTDEELIRVFGDEAPTGESVLKSITADANNGISISYVSKEGNTIATCLSSPTPTNLDPIDVPVQPFTLDYHINNNTPYGTTGLRSFKTIVLTATTLVNIDYSVTPQVLQNECVDFCATCDYKITINIINNDEPDDVITGYPQVFTINPTSSTYGDCSAGPTTPSGLTTSISLDEGSYTIERIIESNQINPGTIPPPAVGGTPYIDQYIALLDDATRTDYKTGSVTVNVYNAAGTLLAGPSTVSMTTIMADLETTTPDINGLYTYLGVPAANSNPAYDPHHFTLTFPCEQVITIPIQRCSTDDCPDLTANVNYDPDPTMNVYDFEKYYIDWSNSTHGITTATITDLLPQYSPGEFNIVVTNMVRCGDYDECKLLKTWRTVFMTPSSAMSPGTFPSIPGVTTPSFPSSTPIDYLDQFISQATYGTGGPYGTTGMGYQITGIDNNVGYLGCGNPGYKFHPYQYIQYDNSNRCITCELTFDAEIGSPYTGTTCSSYSTTQSAFTTAFNGTSPTLTVANPAYSTSYPSVPTTITMFAMNDFLKCLKNSAIMGTCSCPTTSPGSSSTFASGAVTSCEQACEDRYPMFVTSLIDAYHDIDIQVDGDPWDLVASGGTYIFGTTPHTFNPSTDIALSELYCQVDALEDVCKSKCALTIQSDGSVGSAAEFVQMATVMYGVWDIAIPNPDCLPDYKSTGSHAMTFDAVYDAGILNDKLASLRSTAPANGFYWDYSDYLTGELGIKPEDDCKETAWVFIHPDIPSYFEAVSGDIVYVFNEELPGGSMPSRRLLSLTPALTAGTGGFDFVYTAANSTTQATAIAVDLIPGQGDSYYIDASFLPFVVSSSAPGVTIKTLTTASSDGTVVPGTTAMLRYSNGGVNNDINAKWRQILCPKPTDKGLKCHSVCYKISPIPTIDPGDELYGDEFITYTPITCEQETATEFLNTIYSNIDAFVNTQMNLVRQEYKAKCIDMVVDDLEISFDVYYHHYTLYHYDRAGNLVKTIPPQGIDLTSSPTNRSTHPTWNFITEYEYNSLGQLIRQKTPDGGESRFFYDSKARLRFSQNEKQLNHTTGGSPDPKMSYTKYDELGRIIEVGELSKSVDPTQTELDDITYPTSGGTQITVTKYSTPVGSATYFGGLPQRYLQNRVSYTYTDVDGSVSTSGDRVITFYSYDPHGNVEWMLQDVPEIGRSYIGYEYDLISGSVIKVKYNEQLPDKFFHRYTYDVDKRIKTAETSDDGVFWEKQADYTYYLHGPLKRTVTGHDKVQGTDYVYTLQGWLKALNHTDISHDPGLDSDPSGHTDVARDAYAMILGYHHGDFMNNSSAFNANESTNPHYLHEATRDLYNGNISSWTSYYDNEAVTRVSGSTTLMNMDVATGRTFHYDELNRIRGAVFNTFNGSTWTSQSDYLEDFAYDANGNILNQFRNGYSATSTASERLMDKMTYNYYSTAAGSNQLQMVSDAFDNSNPARYEDIKDQSGLAFPTPLTNYKYDEIGNLVSDFQEGIDAIDWNVYGKISKITKASGTVLEFLYDATGKRVYKKVYNTAAADPILSAETSYYTLDASGNPMAIYKRTNTTGSPYLATFELKEQAIYGSDRLGVRNSDLAPLRAVSFTSTTTPGAGTPPTPTHLAEFNNMISPTVKYGFLFTSPKGGFSQINTTVTPAVMTYPTAYFAGGVGSNTAVYEDGCGNVILRSLVMANYNGGTNVPLIYSMSGAMFNTVGMKSYSNGKDLFMKVPAANDLYFYFTIGADRKPYYHVLNAITGGVVSMNGLMDNGTYNYAMALIEDRATPGNSRLYMKRVVSGTQIDVVYFTISSTGVISGPITTGVVTSGETTTPGMSEMQVNPAGDKLLVGNNLGTPNAFGIYSGGGQFLSYAVSTSTNIVSFLSASAGIGANSLLWSFDYTASGSNIIHSHISTAGGLTVRRRSASSLAASTTFTYTIPTVGDIRRGANGNLYISNAIGFARYELKTPDASGWTSGSTTYLVSTSLPSGVYASTGLSLNRHLIYFPVPCAGPVLTRNLGNIFYELKDHLGNVHVVITDRKISILASGVHDHYIADVVSAQDYYSFGMVMPGRNFVSSNTYRYGFNGKEKDNEIKGIEGSSLDFGARIYDPRLGRWFSVDDAEAVYPGWSPYRAYLDNPLIHVDVDGNIEIPLKVKEGKNQHELEWIAEDWQRKSKKTGKYYGPTYSGFWRSKKDNAATLNFNAYKTGLYVVRSSEFHKERTTGTTPHVGVDYAVPEGTEFYSLGDGTITGVATWSGGISALTIKYANGDEVSFLHYSSLEDGIEVGKKVTEGQLLGHTGSVGATAAHLHVQAKDVDGNEVDPESRTYGTESNSEFFFGEKKTEDKEDSSVLTPGKGSYIVSQHDRSKDSMFDSFLRWLRK